MAVTFTGDSHKGYERQIVLITTDLKHKCTDTFRGTSSAAPLASGMFALVLQANPNLSWRDLQHIVVKTAKMTSPKDEGWKMNAAGNKFNHKFGFGRLDALSLVNAAENWRPVPEQHICKVVPSNSGNDVIPLHGELILRLRTDGCSGTENSITRLEHVQATLSFTLTGASRGDLSIDIRSPSGTVSNLLNIRRNDRDKRGLKEWAFMTVHLWGEDPRGDWRLLIKHHEQESQVKKDARDVEDEERMLIDKHKMKARRDEILNDYDSYHDEIHHGRFGGDYMRDEIQDDEGQSDQGGEFLTAYGEKAEEPTEAGVVTSWHLTFYGTAE